MRTYRIHQADYLRANPHAFTLNRTLSWEAIGLLAYLLSFSDEELLDLAQKIALFPDEEEEIAKALRELLAAGYLVEAGNAP